MGMSLIQTEIASSLGYGSSEDLDLRIEEAERLVSGDQQKTSLEWFQLTQEVRTSAVNAVDVLSYMLNWDKIASDQLQLELAVIPFWHLLERTANEFRLSAAKNKLQVSLDFSDTTTAGRDAEDCIAPFSSKLTDEAQCLRVVGDDMRLTQAMRNLLSNAIKFAPEGGSISVRTTWKRRQTDEDGPLQLFNLKNGEHVSFRRDGELHVEIKDSGVGMSYGQLARLFHEGIQFNVNELQAGKGSGIGLYVTTELGATTRGLITSTLGWLGLRNNLHFGASPLSSFR